MTASYSSLGGSGNRKDLFTVNITGKMITPSSDWANLLDGNPMTYVEAGAGGVAKDIFITSNDLIEELDEITLYMSYSNPNYTYYIDFIYEDGVETKSLISYSRQTPNYKDISGQYGFDYLYKTVVNIPKQTKKIKTIIIREGSGVYSNYIIHEIEFKMRIAFENKTLILHDGEYKNWESESVLVSEKIIVDTTTDLVPKLTSNTSSNEGFAFSKDIYSVGYEAFYAFDDTLNSEGYVNANGSQHGYVGFCFNSGKKVLSYSVTSATNYEIYAIAEWYLEASNNTTTGNDGDWIELDYQNTSNWGHSEKRLFNIAQDKIGTYKAYRIRHIRNNSSASDMYCSVNELEFFGEKTIKEYRDVFKWKTVSSTLPTSQQFLEKGIDNLSPLLDRRVETLEPQPMTDKSEILLQNGNLFAKTIDLKKYTDIRSIKLEVK